MGTNFYLHDKPPCASCGRDYEARHIGKSSFGWCFTLHIIPEDGINDLADWEREWSKPGALIRDEYGDTIDAKSMRKRITERHSNKDWMSAEWGFDGYANEADFHARNQSERGPNNLLRHKLSTHCVKHGAGTWDCLIGEFS